MDLGVWASLQAKAEKEHFGKRCEVNTLTRSVLDTWNHGHLDDMITKVFNRLRNVLVLIVEGKGKNDLVETKRGKNFYMLDLPIDLTAVDDAGEVPELIPTANLYNEEEVFEEDI